MIRHAEPGTRVVSRGRGEVSRKEITP